MNKRFLYNNRFHRTDGRITDKGICLEPVSDVKDKNEQLLSYIFSCDPVTGLPKGDIAAFLGENTNAEVKTFIQMNLMKDNVQQENQTSIPTDIMNKMRETINDDDIAYFSRNDGEDADQYAKRMHDYFENEKYKNALRKNNERIKSIIKHAFDGSEKD